MQIHSKSPVQLRGRLSSPAKLTTTTSPTGAQMTALDAAVSTRNVCCTDGVFPQNNFGPNFHNPYQPQRSNLHVSPDSSLANSSSIHSITRKRSPYRSRPEDEPQQPQQQLNFQYNPKNLQNHFQNVAIVGTHLKTQTSVATPMFASSMTIRKPLEPHSTLSNREATTAIGNRQLEAFHRSQMENHIVRSTLEMEKKQYLEAYQELKANTERQKRQLCVAYEELKAISDSYLRQINTLKHENTLLNMRLRETVEKLERSTEVAKNSQRDKSPDMSMQSNSIDQRLSGHQGADDVQEWKEKHHQYKKRTAEAIKSNVLVKLNMNTVKQNDGECSDPEETLNRAGKKLDEFLSHASERNCMLEHELLHKDAEIQELNTMIKNMSEQLQVLEVEHNMNRISAIREDSKMGVIDLEEPIGQTVPLEEERNLLIEWKCNIQKLYDGQLDELKNRVKQLQAHGNELESRNCTLERSLSEAHSHCKSVCHKKIAQLESDFQNLEAECIAKVSWYESEFQQLQNNKTCDRCKSMSKTIIYLNEELNVLKNNSMSKGQDYKERLSEIMLQSASQCSLKSSTHNNSISPS